MLLLLIESQEVEDQRYDPGLCHHQHDLDRGFTKQHRELAPWDWKRERERELALSPQVVRSYVDGAGS